eukprot:3326013-Amphidinium_carterae.1
MQLEKAPVRENSRLRLRFARENHGQWTCRIVCTHLPRLEMNANALRPACRPCISVKDEHTDTKDLTRMIFSGLSTTGFFCPNLYPPTAIHYRINSPNPKT